MFCRACVTKSNEAQHANLGGEMGRFASLWPAQWVTRWSNRQRFLLCEELCHIRRHHHLAPSSSDHTPHGEASTEEAAAASNQPLRLKNPCHVHQVNVRVFKGAVQEETIPAHLHINVGREVLRRRQYIDTAGPGTFHWAVPLPASARKCWSRCRRRG